MPIDLRVPVRRTGDARSKTGQAGLGVADAKDQAMLAVSP